VGFWRSSSENESLAQRAISRSPSALVPRLTNEDLAATALRFLHAFFAYEVGDRRPAIVQALRATATGSFAAQLLRAQPRPGDRSTVSAATLTDLTLTRLPDHPDLALASGTAVRPSAPEQFSFLFARRGGRWLASAPGE
jgi:hypothetical protein